MRYFFYFFSAFAGIFISCSANQGAENGGQLTSCPMGTPSAVFSDTMQAVSNHEFTLQGNNSQERVILQSGQRIHLFQSGCEILEQEYRFWLTESSNARLTDPEIIGIAENQFTMLSYLSPSLAGYAGYAGMIQEVAPQILLGQETEFALGQTVEIDKIVTDNETLLTVIFRSK